VTVHNKYVETTTTL